MHIETRWPILVGLLYTHWVANEEIAPTILNPRTFQPIESKRPYIDACILQTFRTPMYASSSVAAADKAYMGKMHQMLNRYKTPANAQSLRPKKGFYTPKRTQTKRFTRHNIYIGVGAY